MVFNLGWCKLIVFPEKYMAGVVKGRDGALPTSRGVGTVRITAVKGLTALPAGNGFVKLHAIL